MNLITPRFAFSFCWLWAKKGQYLQLSFHPLVSWPVQSPCHWFILNLTLPISQLLIQYILNHTATEFEGRQVAHEKIRLWKCSAASLRICLSSQSPTCCLPQQELICLDVWVCTVPPRPPLSVTQKAESGVYGAPTTVCGSCVPSVTFLALSEGNSFYLFVHLFDGLPLYFTYPSKLHYACA